MAGAVEFSSVWRAHRANPSLISALCTWRSPACGGDGAQALDCFSLFVARVLFANFMVCTSNTRFSRAVEAKGQRCNLCTHRESSRPFEAIFVQKHSRYRVCLVGCRSK
jgi:hypothetical protein